MLEGLGYSAKGEIWGGASAALGIINRKGLGKIRHIDRGLLWIQQTAADRRFRYAKVLGKENPADLYTKILDAATRATRIQKLEYEFIDGRSTEAPQLHTLASMIDEFGYGDEDRLCEWVQTISHHAGVAKSVRKRQKSRGNQNSIMIGSRGNTYGSTNTQKNECLIVSDQVQDVFPVRDASQESSIAFKRVPVHVRKLIGSLRDTEQLGVAENRKVHAPANQRQHLQLQLNPGMKVSTDYANVCVENGDANQNSSDGGSLLGPTRTSTQASCRSPTCEEGVKCATSLSRSRAGQCGSIGRKGAAQATPLWTYRIQRKKSSARHIITSHEGREPNDTTKETTHTQKQYTNKGRLMVTMIVKKIITKHLRGSSMRQLTKSRQLRLNVMNSFVSGTYPTCAPHQPSTRGCG